MREKAERACTLTGPVLETLKRRTFYCREKDDTIYPIALANLILHGVDEPHTCGTATPCPACPPMTSFSEARPNSLIAC